MVKKAADILSFIVKVLTLKNKHRVLVGLIIEFTNNTEHIYGRRLLTFLLNSQ